MKKQLYLNEICDSLEKERDQLMHLRRLYSIKPTFKIKSPKKPKFLINNYSRLLTRAQTQYNIDYENMKLRDRLSYISTKNGPYNKNDLRPKSGLHLFKKTFINYSFQDVENMRKTLMDNIKMYDRVNNMKSYYDFDTINKEAKLQVKYMNNISQQNRYIKKPPSLNFIDIEKFKRYIETLNDNEEINKENDNDTIEEDAKEEEKENEEKIKDNNNNNNKDEKEDNSGSVLENKKNITTTNNSTKEKNLIHQ